MRIATSLLFLILSFQTSSQNINDSLLIYYPFNGNSTDQSGNGFDGIVNGATLVNDRFGNANSAYYFDGVDDYINLPNDQKLKPGLPVSFAFWAKYDNPAPGYSNVFTSDYKENIYSGVWVTSSVVGSISINIGDGGPSTSSSRRSKVGTTTLSANTWYFIAGVIKGPNDMDIYVGCQNDGGTYNGSGGSMSYSSDPGNLGRKDGSLGGPPNYFKGSVDDLRYWSRALTPGEIDSLCNNSISVSENAVLQNQISIYPNPAKDHITILSRHSNIKSFTIINNNGQRVYSGNFEQTITISHLAPGLYFIKLYDTANLEIYSQKIIIN